MASKTATYLAFNAIAKRGLTTLTPTRHRPCINHRTSFLPLHNTLVSKANRGKKLPKNHFTSNRPSQAEYQQQDSKKQEKSKRKAAQRTQTSPSLRRVAVEAQRSRGTLIRGKGKQRHVDPEAETKDVTAYCAAETYNIHVAKDLIKTAGGWQIDPYDNSLFPQVLHLRSRPATAQLDEIEGEGDVFVFPSGCVVTWNVAERTAKNIVERVLIKAAENSHPDRTEAEDLEYLEDASREDSEVIGDTIILGTKPLESSSQEHTALSDHHETDKTLTKIALSSALARSTKLAVLEDSLTNYFHTTESIPSTLAAGKKPRFSRAFILRKTGELLRIRAQLNLYGELTDALPDMLWDSPHELGLEGYYEALGRELDVSQRIKLLNERLDYASEIAAVLREWFAENKSHSLEWIIIWLIVIEVLFGMREIWRDWREDGDVDSEKNLHRRYLERELEREGKARRH